MPCAQFGSSRGLLPFLTSTVRLNASPVSKSTPREKSSSSPSVPTKSLVKSYIKSLTEEPKSTKSPRKKDNDSIPSPSSKLGSSRPDESTVLGNARLIFDGRGSNITRPFIPRNSSSYCDSSSSKT